MRLRTMAHLSGEAVTSIRDNSLLSVAAVSTVAISLLVLAIVTLLAVNMQHLARVLDAQVQIVAYFQSGPNAAAAAGPPAASCETPAPAASGSGSGAASNPAAAGAASSGASGAAGGAAATSTAASGTAASGTAAPPGTAVPASAAGAPSAEEQAVLGEIQALPGVTQVQFVSKEQALNNLGSDIGSGLIRTVGADNPLPDGADIYVANPRLIAGVAAQVAAMAGIACVRNNQQYVNDLFGFTQSLRYVGLFLIAALALTTLVVIGNTVRVAVYARRDEIGIMKLVGATNGFIRLPFFIEGAILGLLGALLSGLLVAWGYGWVQRVAAANMPFLPLLPASTLGPRLLEGLALGGLLLGSLGSAISVRRHLNV